MSVVPATRSISSSDSSMNSEPPKVNRKKRIAARARFGPPQMPINSEPGISVAS